MPSKRLLEAQIVECDGIAQTADDDLADIARANLAQLNWNDAQRTPLELVGVLGDSTEQHRWFTDRPVKAPPAQLEEVLERLRTTMPVLAWIFLRASRLPSARASLTKKRG